MGCELGRSVAAACGRGRGGRHRPDAMLGARNEAGCSSQNRENASFGRLSQEGLGGLSLGSLDGSSIYSKRNCGGEWGAARRA